MVASKNGHGPTERFSSPIPKRIEQEQWDCAQIEVLSWAFIRFKIFLILMFYRSCIASFTSTSFFKNLESIGVRDGMGGQGQYRVGRGNIRWAGGVSTVPLPKSDFRHIEKPL